MSRIGGRMALSIREARPADAETMLEHVRALAAEPDVDVPLGPGEFTVTVEEERRILREYADAENSVFLTAWDDATLLGMLNLKSSDLLPGRHRAMLGMSVHRPARGRGIGRALLERSVDWARASRYLTRIELDVYARNAPAVHLYESVGFRHNGRRRAPIWEDETPVDTFMMGLCFSDKAPVPYQVDAPAYTPPPPCDTSRPCHVRDATIDDAPGILELWRGMRRDPQLLVPTAGMPHLRELGAYERQLQATLASENSHALVAESAGRIVGTVSLKGHDRRMMCREALVAINVADGWRGRGIGRALLKAAEERARSGGILRRLTLFVYAENESARGLYESCGYEVEGRVPNAWFQHGRYHDELMMALLLE